MINRIKNLSFFGKILLGFGCFILLLGIVSLLVTLHARQQVGYTKEYVDKDTGETVSTQPNTTPESVEGEPKVTILGSASLYELGVEGLSLDQVALLNNDLEDEAITHLPEHDDIIKVVNPAYNSQTYVVTADLIYKKRTPVAKLSFSIDSLYSFNYRIDIDNRTIYKSKQLLVTEGDYTGDGVPPEEQ